MRGATFTAEKLSKDPARVQGKNSNTHQLPVQIARRRGFLLRSRYANASPERAAMEDRGAAPLRPSRLPSGALCLAVVVAPAHLWLPLDTLAALATRGDREK